MQNDIVRQNEEIISVGELNKSAKYLLENKDVILIKDFILLWNSSGSSWFLQLSLFVP